MYTFFSLNFYFLYLGSIMSNMRNIQRKNILLCNNSYFEWIKLSEWYVLDGKTIDNHVWVSSEWAFEESNLENSRRAIQWLELMDK